MMSGGASIDYYDDNDDDDDDDNDDDTDAQTALYEDRKAVKKMLRRGERSDSVSTVELMDRERHARRIADYEGE